MALMNLWSTKNGNKKPVAQNIQVDQKSLKGFVHLQNSGLKQNVLKKAVSILVRFNAQIESSLRLINLSLPANRSSLTDGFR